MAAIPANVIATSNVKLLWICQVIEFDLNLDCELELAGARFSNVDQL